MRSQYLVAVSAMHTESGSLHMGVIALKAESKDEAEERVWEHQRTQYPESEWEELGIEAELFDAMGHAVHVFAVNMDESEE